MGYIKEIQIPIDNPYKKVPIHAKQNDYNSRFFHVILTNNGENLTAADLGTVEKVAIGITRGDGKQKAFKGEYIVSDCSFSLPLPQWGLERANDTIKCDVMIWGKNANGEDYLIRSALVSVFVEKSAFNSDTIEDAESFDILKDLIEKAEYCHTEVLKSQQIVEAAQTSAEDAAAQAQEWAESINPAELAKKEELKAVEGKVDLHEQRIDKSLGKQAQTIVCPHEACITGSGDEAFLDIDDGYVTVDKIQGKTVATTNLIPYPYAETTKTQNGVTFTINSDGSITVNGTATKNTSFFLVFENPTMCLNLRAGENYALSGCPKGGSDTTFSMYVQDISFAQSIIDYGNGATKATSYTQYYVFIRIAEGYTANNLVFRPMLNTGSEAKPYSKWFAGLKNARFKGITSTGKNLFDLSTFPNGTVNGIAVTIEADGIRLNGTATQKITLYGKKAVSLINYLAGKQTYFYSENNQNVRIEYSISYADGTKYSYPRTDLPRSTLPNKIAVSASPVLIIENGMTFNNQLFKAALYKADSATSYEPYHADTSFAFAEPQDNGEWSTLNITTGKIEKQWAEKVFDGTENWTINTNYTAFSLDLPSKGIAFTSICSPYRSPKITDWNQLKDCEAQNGELVLLIKDSTYSTVEAWKAHLAELAAAGTPLTVRYKTAAVTETDLPSLPTNKYAVVRGGMQYVDTGVADSPYTYGAYNTIVKNYAVDPIGQIFYNADMNKSQQAEIDTLETGKQDALTFDDKPTAESTNPVTSGGVHAALDAKADKTALAELAAEVADNRNILREAKVFTVATVEDNYMVRETAGGEPNLIDGSLTAVKEIRGKTVATENLIPYPYANTTKTENGLTWTDNGDGTITVNGTPTDYTSFTLTNRLAAVGTYTLSGISTGSNLTYTVTFRNSGGIGIGSITSTAITFNTADYSEYAYMEIVIKRDNNNIAINNVAVRPILNAGTEAKPYSKWFAGLKNASFEKIVSTGRNLFDIVNPSYAAKTENVSNYFPKIEDGIFYTAGIIGVVSGVSIYVCVPESKKITLALFNRGEACNYEVVAFNSVDKNGIMVGAEIIKSSSLLEIKANAHFSTTVSIPRGKRNIGFSFFSDTRYGGKFTNIQIQFGTTATAYEPYISDTLSAENPIELAEYDVAYPETGETKRQSKTITFNGTENFLSYENVGEDIFVTSYALPVYAFYGHTEIICNNFNADELGFAVDDGKKQYYRYIVVTLQKEKYPEFDTVDKFKTWLAAQFAAGNPLTVTYKPAEATTEATPFNKSKYIAWKNGSETIEQGSTDNSEYGAITTVKQEYSKLIPKEEV